MRQGIQELTQTKSSRLSVFVIVLTYKVTVDPELVTPATPLLGKTVFMHACMHVSASQVLSHWPIFPVPLPGER